MDIPDGYSQSSLFQTLHYDPEAGSSEASIGGVAVAVIGLCARIDAEDDSSRTANWLAEALTTGEPAFFERLALLCGRYVAFYRHDGRTSVVGDAACVRSIAYARDECVVASHAHLVQRNRRLKAQRVRFPEVRGYPGDATPWPGVFILTPNVVLDVATRTLRRFYPTRAPERIKAREAAALILPLATTSIRNLAKLNKSVVLGLSAGLDSRFALALARNAGVEFPTMTFITDDETAIDADVARVIAERLKIEHHVLDLRHVDAAAVVPRLRETSYHISSSRLVAELTDNPRPWDVFLTANLLEIGRAFFGRSRPITSPKTAAASFMRQVVRKKKITDEVLLGAYRQRAELDFSEFFARTDFLNAALFIDSKDLFYWEHRMPAWHSQTINNRDFVMDTFIPFNARRIFDAMLSVPLTRRQEGAIYKRLISQLLPELNDVPINPPHS